MRSLPGWDDVPEDDLDGATSVPPPPAEPPRLAFPTVDAFVQGFLAACLWVDVTDTPARIWCPQWWRHDTAVVRLEALWRAFEAMRVDPGVGISVWLRDHADPHLAVLTDPQGPFQGCSVRKGHDPTRVRLIPTDPAPAGLFHPDD